MDDSRRKRRRGRGCLVAAAIAAAALALVLSLPYVLTHFVRWPEMTFDLTDAIAPEQRAAFSNLAARVKFEFEDRDGWDVAARGTGVALDWPVSFEARANYSLFGRSADGEAAVSIPGSAWRLDVRFSWSAACGWRAQASLPETRFDERDPAFGAFAARLASDAGVSDLAFSGAISLDAEAAATNGTGIAEWKASGALSDLSASLRADGAPVSAAGVRVRFGASGIGGHVDIAPTFARARLAEAGGVALSNVFASVRATESAWLVTEAGADVCGGTARLYSLFLDPAKLSAGFTLYLDGIDAGLALAQLSAFRGEASGSLHGKLPLRVADGRKVTLGDAYLYSAPGETGTIRMENPEALADSLAAAGLDEASRQNVAKALRNLDYTALRIDLRREDGGHALAVRLEGTATSGKTTVPVSLAVTLRGGVERLLNAGLRASAAAKPTETPNNKEGHSK